MKFFERSPAVAALMHICIMCTVATLIVPYLQVADAHYEESLRHQNFGKLHSSAYFKHHQDHPQPPPTPEIVHYSPPVSKPVSVHHYRKPFGHRRTLAIEGTVNCLSCRYARYGFMKYSKPLEGAEVGLKCEDRRLKTFVSETATTDENGHFLFLVENFDFKWHKGVKACKVFLISSPIASCARPTNLNNGRTGAPLTVRHKLYEGEIRYSTGPFAFSPSPSSCYRY
ncbi:hypothetical protein KP509_13G058200 [Ceratopteris richardii]|uniref:Uncharacterized protein n=1 Tax=Ceratopteris richardii TaxID=49495 RepID=A0A8T2TLF9_CERRI|nr:hypothetical protein KP509_13G058200 [Ceratopteris richardii]